MIDEAGELIAVSYSGSNTRISFKPSATALQSFNKSFYNAEIKRENDIAYTDINKSYIESYHIATPDENDDIKVNIYSITTNSNEKNMYNLYMIRGNEYFSIFITPY
ncbi:MAG: hypothetical protein IJV15_01685 [Lachnospiraceae bacterium]|nr:hypothetical protein [Lachnospiraceae bacterium]